MRLFDSGDSVDPKANLLQTWYMYCRSRSDYSDETCDETRLLEYADYLFEQTQGDQCDSARSHFLSVQTRLAILWTVWRVPADCNRRRRKQIFNESFKPIGRHVEDRINEIYHITPFGKSSEPNAEVVAPSDAFGLVPAATPMLFHASCDDEDALDIAAPEKVVGLPQLDSRDPGEPLAVYSSFGKHKTDLCGEFRELELAKSDKKWRVFIKESDVLLNCILLRRSSYCSLKMRLWHLLSVSTWLDSDVIFNISLGSLLLGISTSQSAFPGTECIVIDSAKIRCTAFLDDNDDDYVEGVARLRRSKSANRIAHPKVELVRHSLAVQCPWNALSMLLFYKWHVLKEPLPNFRDDSWRETLLFGTNDSEFEMRDDQLKYLCGDQYEEYLKVSSGSTQSYKRMYRRSFSVMADMITKSSVFKRTLSTANSITMDHHVLGSSVFPMIQSVNAGVDDFSSNKPHDIPRRQYVVENELKDLIFPFLDDEVTFRFYEGEGNKSDWHKSLAGFCKVLNTLRLVLLQDMMLLFDVKFYRRMLRGSAMMSSAVFQSTLFANCSKEIGEAAWQAEALSLTLNMPKDIILTRVVPEAAHYLHTSAVESAFEPVSALGSALALASDLTNPTKMKSMIKSMDPQKRRHSTFGDELLSSPTSTPKKKTHMEPHKRIKRVNTTDIADFIGVGESSVGGNSPLASSPTPVNDIGVICIDSDNEHSVAEHQDLRGQQGAVAAGELGFGFGLSAYTDAQCVLDDVVGQEQNQDVDHTNDETMDGKYEEEEPIEDNYNSKRNSHSRAAAAIDQATALGDEPVAGDPLQESGNEAWPSDEPNAQWTETLVQYVADNSAEAEPARGTEVSSTVVSTGSWNEDVEIISLQKERDNLKRRCDNAIIHLNKLQTIMLNFLQPAKESLKSNIRDLKHIEKRQNSINLLADSSLQQLDWSSCPTDLHDDIKSYQTEIAEIGKKIKSARSTNKTANRLLANAERDITKTIEDISNVLKLESSGDDSTDNSSMFGMTDIDDNDAMRGAI
ncbi:hypothetical protein BX661DRAFT_176007 [Kickxella alabastrina]|uniref:uncharacterized protein n=1 Tax=Kickxella alabastrina TaxID=61397 RepID=UPI00221E5AD5|nr:uncharacterized protein BX661DRAFT_176007 [Kickxella alabastrina]KAI7835053.1 hypothetical protein BX661DRAFT_176007 [Kickxella alabastrina]